jgi:hypothetical protein
MKTTIKLTRKERRVLIQSLNIRKKALARREVEAVSKAISMSCIHEYDIVNKLIEKLN